MCMGRPTAQGKWKKSYCPHRCMGIHVKERKSIFPFPESCQIVLESERKAEFFGKGGKERFIFEVIVLSKKNGKWERFLKFYSNLWKGKEMERNAVQFRYCGKERESFLVLTGRKGMEMKEMTQFAE